MQPDLARSITGVASDGAETVYAGWLAVRIAADMAANGGLIGKQDLAAYAAKERAPIRGSFLGYDIVSMPPPSSGGTALVEALNMLEKVGIQKQLRGSAAAIHLVTEVRRRAYLDRARFLGDADFVEVPVKRLTSKSHASDLVKTIDRRRATKSADLGRDILTVPVATAGEPEETTHFSVIDRNGMAVANTYTLEGGYGSHVVIAGTGILLNNEMGDFNKKPGTTNLTGDIGTAPNVIAPGKRMLSSMTPTIVTRRGKVVLITGSPGGRTIINTVLDVVLNVTAWRLTGREAIDAARADHEWMPDRLTIEADGAAPDTIAALTAMGHEVNLRGRQGDAHSIWIDPKTGLAIGVPDARDSGGRAVAAAR